MNQEMLTDADPPPYFRWEIVGDNKPARVVLEWPAPEGAETDIQVTLEQENLAASGPAWLIDPAAFAAFFEDLAREDGIWEDEKSLKHGCDNFTITSYCFRYIRGMTRHDEVNLCFTLASDMQEPLWSVTLRLVVPVERMPALTAGAVSFFQAVSDQRERMAPEARRKEKVSYLKSWFRHVEAQEGKAALTLSSLGSSLTDMDDKSLAAFVVLPVGARFQQKYRKWGMIWTIYALDEEGVTLEFEETGQPPSHQTLSTPLPSRDRVKLSWT